MRMAMYMYDETEMGVELLLYIFFVAANIQHERPLWPDKTADGGGIIRICTESEVETIRQQNAGSVRSKLLCR